MTFQKVLEKFKQQGFYAVQVYYGEGVGADDMSVEKLERRIRLFAQPVGCLGEVLCAYSGKLSEFLTFDFTRFPTQINQEYSSAKLAAMEVGGWYCWGIPKTVEHLRDNWSMMQGLAL
jgi:hypothetical protein